MTPLKMGDVADAVCREFNVSTEDIFGRSRFKRATVPRQAAMAISVSLLGKSTVEVGRFIGGRDHTTVMHGRDAHAKRYKSDFEYAEHCDGVLRRLAVKISERVNQ